MTWHSYTLELTVPVTAVNDDDAEDRIQRIIQRIEDMFDVVVEIKDEEPKR